MVRAGARGGEPRQCRGSMMLFLFSRAEGARSGKAISEAEDGMGQRRSGECGVH
jgi:hypothetical protein